MHEWTHLFGPIERIQYIPVYINGQLTTIALNLDKSQFAFNLREAHLRLSMWTRPVTCFTAKSLQLIIIRVIHLAIQQNIARNKQFQSVTIFKLTIIYFVN